MFLLHRVGIIKTGQFLPSPNGGGNKLRKIIFGVALSVCVVWGIGRAQEPRKIEFQRDVQPLFKARCYGCHGPKQQKNGFRLDRRSDAMRGGTIGVIGRFNSEGSRLYNRLKGDEFGIQMPPTGALPAAEVEIIKEWIDQGAVWPDEASGETPPPPPDGVATAMTDALRKGDGARFQKLMRDEPTHINLRGPGGATPLMFAALYGNADAVHQLLKGGADPNLQNEAGATALMWGTDSLEIERLLIERGANVNARSSDARTPLLIASGENGGGPVVELLLDHGANPSAQSPALFGLMTPLAEAAYARDENAVKMLLAHGADVKSAGFNPLGFAILSHCSACVDLLLGKTSHEDLNMQVFLNSPPLGNALAMKDLLDRGADANAKDPDGNTLLMLAAASDELPLDAIKSLVARGADLNAKNNKGECALDFARAGEKRHLLIFLSNREQRMQGPPREFI